MSIRVIPALAAVLSLAAAGQAFAQPYGDDDLVVRAPYAGSDGREVHFKRVAFADLDLSSPAGGYTLLGRIRAAARDVCTPEPSRNLADNADYEDCFEGAVSRAVYDVDAPSLSDAYGARQYARGYNYSRDDGY